MHLLYNAAFRCFLFLIQGANNKTISLNLIGKTMYNDCRNTLLPIQSVSESPSEINHTSWANRVQINYTFCWVSHGSVVRSWSKLVKTVTYNHRKKKAARTVFHNKNKHEAFSTKEKKH